MKSVTNRQGTHRQKGPESYSYQNATSNLITQVTLSGVNFFITPMVIGYFGIPLFGVLALCIQITGFCQSFGQSFISAIQRDGIVEASGDPAREQSRILGTSVVLSLLFALVISLIFWVVYSTFLRNLVSPEYLRVGKTLFIILAVFQVLILLFSSWEAMILISGRIYILSWAIFIGQLSLSLLLIFFLKAHETGIILLGLCYASGRVLGLGGGVLVFMRSPKISVPKISPRDFSLDTAKTLTSFSFQVTMGTMASLIFYSSDAIIIALLPSLTEADITYYRVAQRWDGFIRMLTVGVASGLMPALLTSIQKQNPSEISQVLQSGVKYVLLVAMAPAVFLFFYAEEFYKVWLGDEFVSTSAPLLKLLMISVVICAPGRILHGVNMGYRQIKIPVRVVLCFACLNIPLSLYLGGSLGWGLMGICLATTVCMIFATLINSGIAIRKAGMSFGSICKGIAAQFVWIPLGWILYNILIRIFPCDTLANLVVHVCIFGSFFLIYAWIFLFNKIERRLIVKKIF